MQNFVNNLIAKKEYDFGTKLTDLQKEKYNDYCSFLIDSINKVDKPEDNDNFKNVVKIIWSEMLHNHSTMDIIIKKYYNTKTKDVYTLFSFDDYKIYIADICMYIMKDNETKFAGVL